MLCSVQLQYFKTYPKPNGSMGILPVTSVRFYKTVIHGLVAAIVHVPLTVPLRVVPLKKI